MINGATTTRVVITMRFVNHAKEIRLWHKQPHREEVGRWLVVLDDGENDDVEDQLENTQQCEICLVVLRDKLFLDSGMKRKHCLVDHDACAEPDDKGVDANHGG